MAYAFDQINQMLGDEDQQNQQNIFTNNPDAQASTLQPGIDTKTTTEGELGGGGGAGVAATAGAATSPQTSSRSPSSISFSTNANRAALKANVGKTEKPKALTDIQSQISDNQKRLQDEANAYQTQSAQNYRVSDSDIEKAIGGDQEKWGSVTNLLRKKDVDPVAEFAPSDIDVKDVDRLNNNAGVRSLVSRGQDENYTRGMAAFDAGVLQRDPNFINEVRNTQTQNEALQRSLAGYQKDLPTKIKNEAAANLKSSQEAASGYLGSNERSLREANQAEANAANELLKRYRTEGDEASAQEFLKSVEQDTRNRLLQVDPRAAELMDLGLVDPRAFQNVRQDYVENDFVSPEEASRFNAIMGLLGRGDTASASLPRGPDVTYNDTAAEDLLYNAAMAARGEQKDSAQTEMDQILRSAGTRADAMNAERRTFGQTAARDAAQEALMNSDDVALNRLLAEKSTGTSFLPTLPSDFDLTPYYSAPTDVMGREVISQKEAENLNRLASILGSSTVYSPGSIQASGPYAGTLDKAGMFGALKDYIARQTRLAPQESTPLALPQLGAAAIRRG